MLVRLSLRYARTYWPALVGVALLQIIQTAAALSLPTLNADIIDNGVIAGDTAYIWRTGGEMLAISAVQGACAIVVAYLAARTAMGIGRDLRRDLFDTVQSYGPLELTKFGPPSLITRTTNDVQQIQTVLVMTLSIIVQVPIMLVGGVVMAMRQDVELSWLLVALVPVLVIVMGLAMWRMGPLFRSLQTKLDAINRVMREQLAGVQVIRAFVRQDAEREHFQDVNVDLRDTSIAVGMWMAFLFPAVMIVVNVAQVGVIWFGGMRIEAGAMEVGSLIAFLNYLMQIFMSVMMAVMMFMVVPRAEVCAVRANEVLETTPAITTPAAPREIPAGPLRVALDDVSVRYPGAENDVLSHVSFAMEPGTTTAVIGSTGSGKSTLVQLLPRLLDVAGGAVTVNGVSVTDVNLTDLRRRIAMVPQRAFLFEGTIASNMRLGSPAITDEEIWEALTAAQAADFVRALPLGLEAPVEQGGRNFSGGQRQRLTIARALSRRADLTVFDDSFSALDFATDARLRAALPDVLAGRARLIVAQRVATIRGAEKIIVLDDGRVVGEGTHESLMETCETYREIVLSQLSAEEAA